MAISRVRFAATGDVTQTTSLALPLGATATAGNVLVAVWAIDKNVTSITAPSGWTTLASQLGTSVSFLVCGKVANGTETTATASYSGGSGAPSGASGVIAEYSGVDTSNPWGPSNLPTYSDTAVTSKTLDPAAATAAGAALAFFAMDSLDAAAAGSTGFQPTATGFTWVTTAYDSASGTANSGTPGAALVENLSISSGQDIAPSFSWTRSDQVAGFIQLLNAATGPVKVGSVSGVTSGSGTSFTVPAGVTTAHLGVVLFANANPYTSGFTITMPAGWTTRADHPSQANNSEVYVFTRLGGYTAGDTLTWSQNSATGWAYYAVWFNTGGQDVTVTGSVGGRSGVSSSDVVIPSITASANQGVIVVATERTTATGTTISSWNGFTPTQDLFAEENGTTNTTGFIGHFTQSTAGSTGYRTVTYSSGSGNGAGLMLGLGTPSTTSPTIRASTISTVTQATPSISTNKPTGTAVGDTIYLLFASDDNVPTGVPSGFTQIYSADSAGASGPIHARVYRRIADGSEGSTFTVTCAATADAQLAALAVTGGLGSGEVFSTFSDQTSGTAGTSMTANSVTPSADNSLVIGAFVSRALTGAVTTATPPSGFTEIQDGNQDWISLEVCYQSGVPASATGTKTATSSASGYSGNWLMAIPPVPGVGGSSASADEGAFLYNGTWLYDSPGEVYTNQTNASSKIDFSIGSGGGTISLLATKSNIAGILGVSIDGGAETTVDCYAASSAVDAVVWTSSTLTAGSHTLLVRCTGTKNASSGNTYIAVGGATTTNGTFYTAQRGVYLAGQTTMVEDNATTTTLVCPVPAGAAVGEWLIAYVSHSTSTAPTTPAGWTLIASDLTTNVSTAAFHRLVTSTEPASYSFTVTSGRSTAMMARIAGADLTSPFDVAAQGLGQSTAATSKVWPDVTTTVNGTLVVDGMAEQFAVTYDLTPPAEETSQLTTTGTGRKLTLATEARPTKGALGTRTWASTNPTVLQWAGVRVFYKPRTAPLGLPYVEPFTGTSGATWPSAWTTTDSGAIGANATIQGNSGRLTFPSVSGYQRGMVKYLSTMPAVGDCEITATVTFAQIQEEYLHIYGRAASDVTYGYGLNLYPANGTATAGIVRFDNTGETNISGDLSAGTWTANVPRKIRLRILGNTISAKVWDATATEPTSWLSTVTDTYASGKTGRVLMFAGTGSTTSSGTVAIDDLVVAPLTPAPIAAATAGDGQTSGVSSLSITIPNSVQPGDVAILEAYNSTAAQTLTTPSGWTLASGNNSTTGLATWVFTRTIVAGDAGSAVTLTFGSSARCGAYMSVWNRATLTNAQVQATTDSATGTAPVVPTVASAASGSVFLVNFARRNAATTTADDVTQLTGYNTTFRMASAYGTTPQYSLEQQYKGVPTAGSVGGETATSSQSSNGVYYSIALPSALAGGAPPQFEGAGTASGNSNATGDGTTGVGKPLASSLVDTFSTQDATKWVYSAGASASNGRLTLTPNTSYTGSVASVGQYCLHESSIYIQLPQAPDFTNTSSEFWFQLNDTSASNNNTVGFDLIGGTVKAFRDVGGVRSNFFSVAYNATNHGWLRFRETAGTVFWDASADGVSWTNLTSWDRTFGIGSAYVLIGTGYTGTPVPSVTPLVDNVNSPVSVFAGAGTASGNANATADGTKFSIAQGQGTASAAGNATGDGSANPLLSSLVDAFATQDATKWSYSAGASASAGLARIVRSPGYAVLRSVKAYEVSGSSVYAELVSDPATTGTYSDTALQLYTGVGDANGMTLDVEYGGPFGTTKSIAAYIKTNGVWSSALGATAYSPTAHRWLRLRELAGTFYWEASPDATTWTVIYSTTTPSFLAGNTFSVQLISGDGNGETVLWDNVNYVPVVFQGAGTPSGNANATGAGTFVRPTGTLTEDWNSGFNSTLWWKDTPITVSGGRLVLPSTGTYVYAGTQDQYTLLNSSIAAELIPGWTTNTSNEIIMYLDFLVPGGAPSGTTASFLISGTTLVARTHTNNVMNPGAVSAPWDPVAQRFLRMRNPGDSKIYFETSADSVTWDVFSTQLMPSTMRTGVVVFASGHWQAGDPDSSAQVDNVNMQPPVIQGTGTVTGNGGSSGTGDVWKLGVGTASMGTDAYGDGTFFNPANIVVYSTLTGTFAEDDGDPVQGLVVLTPESRVRIDSVNKRLVVLAPKVIELDVDGSFVTSVPGNEAGGRVFWRFRCELIRTDDPRREIFYFTIPIGTDAIDLADAVVGAPSDGLSVTRALYPSDSLYPSDNLYPSDI